MDAGQVLDIAVPDSPLSGFRVKWRINAKLRGLVRRDSIATIGTEGVVGGTYLSVRAGSAHAPAAALLATIPSKEPTDLSDLLHDADGSLKQVAAKVGVALDAVTTTASNANDLVVNLKNGHGTAGMLLTDDRVADQLRRSLPATASDVRELVADLKQGRGVAGILLRDQEVAGRVRETVSNVQQATADLGHATRQADALASGLNARRIPEKAGEIVDHLADTARQAHQVMSEVATPDRLGMTAGANINEATGNLADATEALKHNFLTRGFFKSRGYYTLADISPEKYRRDGGLTSRSTRRLWLPGAELFQTGANGEEELSAKGQALLIEAIADRPESIVERALIIEGYSNRGASANQLRVSRTRAMLVRQYVRTQFQLDAKNLGVVPLKDAPPDGVGRTTWDGVCIVVLGGE
jgi:phospholipid/cholesterol/gamma-HCH transport system substrate-binding protein